MMILQVIGIIIGILIGLFALELAIVAFVPGFSVPKQSLEKAKQMPKENVTIIRIILPPTRNIAKSGKVLIWSVFRPLQSCIGSIRKSLAIRFMPYCQRSVQY